MSRLQWLLWFLLRLLLPRRWSVRFWLWWQDRKRSPLAACIDVHAIRLDGCDILNGRTNGSAFCEHAFPIDVNHRFGRSIEIEVQNVGAKPVLFHAAAILKDLVLRTDCTLVPFPPRRLEPGQVARCEALYPRAAVFSRLMIPTLGGPIDGH